MNDLTYKETNNKHLDNWMPHLSEEEKIQLNSDLSDYEWYSIIDKNQTTVSIFQIINVRNHYSKNLDIHFSPSTKNNDDIIAIVIFIFESILNICSESKIKMVKFHTHDALLHEIFIILADEYQTLYIIDSVKKYGKWIEVELNITTI